MILEALRSACQHHGVPDLDEGIDAYIAAGTLSAGDRAVLDGIAHMGSGHILNYLRGRVGTQALQVAYIAYREGIGGGPISRG
ncbi:hypothetical protein GCM10010399_95490 [Dactylosporangium fulvum]|uniref:Uncharacterized protein n=1 Tax=Dactylosporangium fulvum TaxID=53359 RepID=A0ABY5W795_9ACTN|nr:hypothetical protein [Dactylosporangium fulvum]UWP85893.1 hypothetical protein Dfulv_17240 [Dactylosporangium fulvum]